MLDLVFLAMFVVVPILLWSIYLVRYRKRYSWHKTIQLTLASVLLVAISLFELDLRLLTDWKSKAAQSPYYGGTWNWVNTALAVHLTFAIPTLLLWITVVIGATRGFSSPPQPGPHSRWHRPLGWVAVVGMLLTAVTGWIFYWMAFVA